MTNSPRAVEKGTWIDLIIATGVLMGLLLFVFSKSFSPDFVLFSNDGPLGTLLASQLSTPEVFTGFWADLNWLGYSGGAAPPTLSYGLLWLLGPISFAKFYGPLTQLILGMGAWTFFRSLGLSRSLSIVAAIAAAFNMNFFSNMAWGLGTRPLTLAMVFFCLASLNRAGEGWRGWARVAVGGIALGVAVMEGADNGAIFSVYVAAFTVFAFAFARSNRSIPKSAGILAVVVLFSVLASAHTLISLVDTTISPLTTSGVVETPAERWSFATQWSLPKLELLRVLIPGLFGYRMDTPDGGVYWGSVGRAPGWTEQYGAQGARFSGAGEYAGIVVLILGSWAVFQAFRKDKSVFEVSERKLIMFWAAMMVVSVLIAVGKFGPFYQAVFALPYFSSIRNPMKWMHPANLCFLILFGYALLGLQRRYLSPSNSGNKAFSLKTSPESKWIKAMIILFVMSVIGFIMYKASGPRMLRFMAAEGLRPEEIPGILAFSHTEVLLYLVFLALAIAVMIAIFAGWFSGKKAAWAAVLLGTIVFVDLVRSDLPWIVYWDYKYKYSSNPIIDLLRDKPYEHRVTIFPLLPPVRTQEFELFHTVYGIEWTQQLFPFYDVQSFDVVQDPRAAVDKRIYMGNFTNSQNLILGQWRLGSARYVLGPGGNFAEMLNQQLDPQKSFRTITNFSLQLKPGRTQLTSYADLTVVPNPNGGISLLEYGGALPRAKLYENWLVSTNDNETLAKLVAPDFDPQSLVIVSGAASRPSTGGSTNVGGSAEISSYSPKKIGLKVNAAKPSILLLNDRHHPDWHVYVDGREEKLLRANYIVRGVEVPAGTHEVVFQFKPSLKGLYISLVTLMLGLVLLAVVFLPRRVSA
jgi:hypothetical protein